MLSKSCVYAIRSIVFIAHKARIDAKIGIKEIAEELELPTPYLGKIMQKLTGNGIVNAVKGPRGGFFIPKEGQGTKIIKVIEVMDGLDFFTNCGLGLKECSEDHPCPLHDDLKIYRDGLWKLYNNKTIGDMVASVDTGFSFVKNT